MAGTSGKAGNRELGFGSRHAGRGRADDDFPFPVKTWIRQWGFGFSVPNPQSRIAAP